MSIRTTFLLASAAILALSSPATAQDASDSGAQAHQGSAYDGAWQGEWADGETWRGEWSGTYTNPEGRAVEAQHHGQHGDRRPLGASPDGRLGYTMAEREAWLADCRLLMADGGGYHDEYYEDDGDGGLIGGLLGAVIGGVAGNRIGGRGDRLLGTAIGAGVGGIAGAAIGSAVDADQRGEGYRDRNELWAARYCDAYLRRYEMGGGTWSFAGGHSPQIMMVSTARAPSRGHDHGDDCRTCRETVTEEWVEIEGPAPQIQPESSPTPEPRGKLTPIR